MNQRQGIIQPTKEEKSLPCFSQPVGYPREWNLCWTASVSIPLWHTTSPLPYLHLSSGTRALGQIPSTCALVITELDQLLLPAPERASTPCFLQQPGTKDSMSFCNLNLHLSIVPKQTRVGTLYPERDGATHSMGTRSTCVGMSSCLTQQLAFPWKRREIRPTSQDFILGNFWPMHYCIHPRCSCVLAKERSKG